MSLAELRDWSRWIRYCLADSAEAWARGEALRRRIGDVAYGQRHGEGLGAEWKLAEWAARQPDPWDAWGRCSRADWLLLALAHAGADGPTRTLCAADVVRMGLRHVPEGEPYVLDAIEAAEAWAGGHQTLAHVQRLARRAARFAENARRPSTRLVAEAVAGLAGVVRGGSGVEAARAALADGPDPDEVATSHRIGARVIRERLWVPSVPTDLDWASDRLQAAWHWLAEHVPVVQLTTVQVLAARSVQWALVGPPRERPASAPTPHVAADGPLVHAIAERIASAPEPILTMRRFLRHLDRGHDPDDVYPFGLQQV